MCQDRLPRSHRADDALYCPIHVAHEQRRMQMREFRPQKPLRAGKIVHAARDQERAQFFAP